MATKLEKPLKRALSIRGKPFVVTITPDALKLVGKGRRKGLELAWEDLVSGDAALATALMASIRQKIELEPARQPQPARRSKRRRAA